MNRLWTRSVASIRDGKLEEFKRFAGELVRSIREEDSDTLNYAIFLDEPGSVAVIIEQYASSAGWLAHSANLEPLMPRLAELCEFTEVDVYGDLMPEEHHKRRVVARADRFERVACLGDIANWARNAGEDRARLGRPA